MIRRLTRAVLPAVAATLVAAGLTISAVAPAAAETHKIRSASFIRTALEHEGFKVIAMRRKAQLYVVKAELDGVVAILAINALSSQIVGVNVVSVPAGVTAKPAGSGPRHYTSVTTEFGYEVEESSFSSYTEVTTEEITTSESYEEVSYAESEEVEYEDADDDSSGDLDEGSADDDAGDDAADED